MPGTRTSTAAAFQTPPRILIPKLVRSRDGWKAKATRRKAQVKALQVRVRDLTASRRRHRERAEALAEQLDVARQQLEHTRLQLAQARPLEAAAPGPQKKAPRTSPPAAGTTRCR